MIPLLSKVFDQFQVIFSRTNTRDVRQKAKARGTGNSIDQSHHMANTTTYINNSVAPTPDIFVQIYGDGSSHSFRGHIENRSGRMLVVGKVKINQEKTELNATISSRGSLGFDEVNFPVGIFTNPLSPITTEVDYRTLDDTGRSYIYTVQGEQVSRVAGGYNIEFPHPPIVRSAQAKD